MTARHPTQPPVKARCPECGQTFDLSDIRQAEEWFFGHDCES